MEALSYCQLMERCLAAEARVVELTAENVVMREIIDAVRGVADKSGGIAGWHLNGDIAKWSEILPEIDDIETPATDHIVAAQRSAFVDEAVAKITESGALTFGDCIVALCQLRECTK